MTYVFSLRIRSHATAMAQVFAYHFLISFLLLVAYTTISVADAFTPSSGMSFSPFFHFVLYSFFEQIGLGTATKILAKVFCALSPNFNLGYCFLTLLNFFSPTPRNGRNWLTMDVLGFPCLMLLVHAVFWYLSYLISTLFNYSSLYRWSLLMLLEYRSSMKIRKLYQSNMFNEVGPIDEDFDVVNERQRVDQNTDDVILVHGVRKEYPEGKNVKVFLLSPLLTFFYLIIFISISGCCCKSFPRSSYGTVLRTLGHERSRKIDYAWCSLC
jgi:hypothetical protein